MAQIKTVIQPQAYEVVRNRIGEILADELDNQVLLTYDTEIDATIYIERSVPFSHVDMPAVNVLFSRGDYNNETVIDVDGSYTYYIDIYAKANTDQNNTGDKLAMIRLQKLIGVCRAIIEDAKYNTLGFVAPFVMNRRIESILIAIPKESEALSIVMGRITLMVKLPETSTLITASLISGYDTQVKLALTNKGYVFSGNNIPIPPNVGNVDVNNVLYGVVDAGDILNVVVINSYNEELGSLVNGLWQIPDQEYKDSDGVDKAVPAGTPIICKQTVACADANVKNTDNSYNVNVISGGTLILPDITHTDSDGSPVTKPAQVPFVATLCDTSKTMIFSFDASGNDDQLVTIEADQSETYDLDVAVLTNVATVIFKKNTVAVTGNQTFAVSDTLEVIITRTTPAVLSKVKLVSL